MRIIAYPPLEINGNMNDCKQQKRQFADNRYSVRRLIAPETGSEAKQPSALDYRREEPARFNRRGDKTVADKYRPLAHTFPERKPLHPLQNLFLHL